MNAAWFKLAWCRPASWLPVLLLVATNSVLGETKLGSSLGDTRAGIVTTAEEQAMGRAFVAAARGQMRFIDDPLLVNYIETLGQRLAAGLNGDTDHLRFFLISNKLINAFAAPGGRLAVFTGLVLTTRTEAELASVMAHELAHVAQRHLPRMMERARQRQLPATAGVLAAILLGGQAGAAAMAATSGAALSDQLRYNREYEREADALGLMILTGAGYPASAMIDFLGRLDQENRLQAAGAPEYLRTHPLTQNRLALVEGRLRQYPEFLFEPSLDYHHARARMSAVFGDDADKVAGAFTHDMRSDNPVVARAARYGQLLAQVQLGDHTTAAANAQELARDYPDYPPYVIALSQALLAGGLAEDAVSVFQGLPDHARTSPVVAYYLADALMKAGHLADARGQLRTALRGAPEMAELYRLLARVEGESGHLAQSFQALAEYHYWRDEVDQALLQLQTAAGHSGASAYLEASIGARIKEIEAQIAQDAAH
ncbi:MAG: hypothetical protein CL395_04145 [Acidiferrobacteraceae bacterium]|nr:hypothetical protein [Acidiferrobacteraceae bacterium]